DTQKGESMLRGSFDAEPHSGRRLRARRGRRFLYSLARIVAGEMGLAPAARDDRLSAALDPTRLVAALRQLAALPCRVMAGAVSLPTVGGPLAIGLLAPGGRHRHRTPSVILSRFSNRGSSGR